MTVPVFYSEEMARHVAGDGHPERPERLLRLRQTLASLPYVHDLVFPSFAKATRQMVERVHDPRYLDRLEATQYRTLTSFDADTRANQHSYAASCLAAGAAVAAVDMVCKRSYRSDVMPFALIRPPGHHAEPDRAMGFCFINSAAVAAAHAIAVHGVGRVAIVDWDVHHGNGTQRIFWNRPDVLYASLHQYPHYPGTGAASERGGGTGKGTTLNIPLPAGSNDAVYLEAFDRQLIPALDAFAPELVIVSAGFDADARDPLAAMELSSQAYGEMTRRLVSVAHRNAGGRIVHLLEGGYHLDALAGGLDAVLQALLAPINQEME